MYPNSVLLYNICKFRYLYHLIEYIIGYYCSALYLHCYLLCNINLIFCFMEWFNAVYKNELMIFKIYAINLDFIQQQQKTCRNIYYIITVNIKQVN